MTKKRQDEHSTEFGLWLREQKEIDSSIGFVTTNLDYIWCNYKTGMWMLIEEKRHGGVVQLYQRQLFEKLDKLCRQDKLYCGFHTLVFQNTNPNDGKLWLDRQSITKDQLMDFLQFVGATR